MVRSFFHISYPPPPFRWLYPVLNRLNKTESPALKTRWKAWCEDNQGDQQLALATKFTTLGVAIARLDADISELNKEIEAAGPRVESCIKDCERGRPTALRLESDELAFHLLTSVDSFLFEAKSAQELLIRFVVKFARVVLEKTFSEGDAWKLIGAEPSANPDWLKNLGDLRNLFLHETAPWVACEVVATNPRRYEVLILLRNIDDLRIAKEGVDYVRLDAFRNVNKGLRQALEEFGKMIQHEIDSIEGNDTTK